MIDEEGKKEIYAETRKDLLTRQLSNSERLDGAILTLSTAALGLSLAFIKNVVSFEKAELTGWLIASWWLFGCAIVLTLLSFIASQLGIKTQLTYAEEYYLKNNDEYLTKRNIPARATDYLNYTSAFLFVSALVATIIFVSENLRGEPTMTEDRGSKVHLEKKGAPIPNMQPAPSTHTNQNTTQSGGGQSTDGGSSGGHSGGSDSGGGGEDKE